MGPPWDRAGGCARLETGHGQEGRVWRVEGGAGPSLGYFLIVLFIFQQRRINSDASGVQRLPSRERNLYCQPTGPSPLDHRDDCSRKASCHGSLNSRFPGSLTIRSPLRENLCRTCDAFRSLRSSGLSISSVPGAPAASLLLTVNRTWGECVYYQVPPERESLSNL